MSTTHTTHMTLALFAACALGCTGCRTRDSGSDQVPDSTRSPHAAAPDHGQLPEVDTMSQAPVEDLKGAGAATFLSARELAQAGDALARGTSTARTVAARTSYSLVEARRAGNGVPEVHDCWVDVAIMQAGRATLLSGGHVAGSRPTGRGEHRGGTIAGGTTRILTTADVAVVPAGVPHQYLVASGDTVRYLTIKVLQPGAEPCGGR
ncbi:MAG TPA: hypothetical protein VFP15_14235 [Gemmatimonadaceae bacterium]|nr:hypothetical protein [Gemmatimonadaceae bacterium]